MMRSDQSSSPRIDGPSQPEEQDHLSSTGGDTHPAWDLLTGTPKLKRPFTPTTEDLTPSGSDSPTSTSTHKRHCPDDPDEPEKETFILDGTVTIRSSDGEEMVMDFHKSKIGPDLGRSLAFQHFMSENPDWDPSEQLVQAIGSPTTRVPPLHEIAETMLTLRQPRHFQPVAEPTSGEEAKQSVRDQSDACSNSSADTCSGDEVRSEDRIDSRPQSPSDAYDTDAVSSPETMRELSPDSFMSDDRYLDQETPGLKEDLHNPTVVYMGTANVARS